MPRLLRSLLPLVTLLLALAGGTVALSCRDDGRDGAATTRPASSPAAAPAGTRAASGGGTGSANRPATATRLPAGPRFLVSDFRGSETLLLSVSALDPADRRPLVRIEHAPNFAPRAAVAPGGDRVAYVALPTGARSPDTDGVLWVVDLRARTPTKVATGVDARSTPVWAPDGSRVVCQRPFTGGAAGLALSLDEVSTHDGKTQELVQAASPSRLFPVAYAPDGQRFYYVRFDKDGAFLHEVDTRTRGARQVARLGDGAARDFELSPDGGALIYLALSGTPARYHAQTVDLRTGDVRPLLTGVSRSEDVGVAWRPGSPAAPTVGVITGGDEATGRVLAGAGSPTPITERGGGFDVPVAWSPDGRRLLLRAFAGTSADNPGQEQPVLLDAEGQRRPLSGDGTIEFIGWVTDAP